MNKDKLIYFVAGAGLAYAFVCYRKQRQHKIRRMHSQGGHDYHHQPQLPTHHPATVHQGPMQNRRPAPLPPPQMPQPQARPEAPGAMVSPIIPSAVATPVSPHMPRGMMNLPAPPMMQETFEVAPGTGAVELQGF